MILAAVVFFVIVFVLPTPGVHTEVHIQSGVGAVLLSARKPAMWFCVGLLVSAIAISLQSGFPVLDDFE